VPAVVARERVRADTDAPPLFCAPPCSVRVCSVLCARASCACIPTHPSSHCGPDRTGPWTLPVWANTQRNTPVVAARAACRIHPPIQRTVCAAECAVCARSAGQGPGVCAPADEGARAGRRRALRATSAVRRAHDMDSGSARTTCPLRCRSPDHAALLVSRAGASWRSAPLGLRTTACPPLTHLLRALCSYRYTRWIACMRRAFIVAREAA
jgi:hypothetical protein